MIYLKRIQLKVIWCVKRDISSHMCSVTDCANLKTSTHFDLHLLDYVEVPFINLPYFQFYYLISFTKKNIYYFRVVFAGGKKEYVVEQKTYSSRVVNNIKIASKHKGHLKVYARPIFVMFCIIVC